MQDIEVLLSELRTLLQAVTGGDEDWHALQRWLVSHADTVDSVSDERLTGPFYASWLSLAERQRGDLTAEQFLADLRDQLSSIDRRQPAA